MCFIFAYVFICYFFTVIKNEKPYEKPKTKCMGTSTTNLSETAPLLKGGLLNKDVSKGNYSAVFLGLISFFMAQPRSEERHLVFGLSVRLFIRLYGRSFHHNNSITTEDSN